MELIPHNTKIDFVKYRHMFVTGSLIINVAILIGIAIFGFNWGVDFKGGSELEVKFATKVEDVAVRHAVEAAGFNEATVQVIGPPEDSTFLIHVGRISLLTKEQAKKAEDAVRAKFGADLASFDFNEEFGDKIELRFKKTPPADAARAVLESIGIKVQPGEEGMRPVQAGYTVITRGISDKVNVSLAEAAQKNLVPAAELRRVEYVGPQVGKQLQRKGILSVLYAALAILAYIALRFDTKFAPGAVIAMFHDIVVVFGYFLVTRREFNLTSVAVLLTIVGYSVNETLSRTILTSFATSLSLVGLLFFGVGQIWDFAAAMIVGIFTGTYSSIYIASPVTIWLEEMSGKAAAKATPPSEAKAG